MNNLDWLCENDREQLRRILRDDVELCEWCIFDEVTCDWECGSGTRLWLEAEHSDGLQPENGISADGGDSNDAKVISNGEKYKLTDAEDVEDAFCILDATDARKKLEADVRATASAIYEKGRIDGDLRDTEPVRIGFEWITGLLDRQAAITERKLCKGCDWPYLAAQPDQEAYDRIAELEAELEKRDKGIARLKAQRDEARAEREALRKKLGGAISHAQAIAGLAEVDR